MLAGDRMASKHGRTGLLWNQIHCQSGISLAQLVSQCCGFDCHTCLNLFQLGQGVAGLDGSLLFVDKGVWK